MQNNYTKQAEKAIRYARTLAGQLDHPYIGTEHLLLGLRKEYTGVAGQILASFGVEENKLLQLMDELISPSTDVIYKEKPENSPRLDYLLDNSGK